MLADEKKQEKCADQFSEEMKRFEEEMKLWRKDFAEDIKKYKWETVYNLKLGEEVYKGTYKGKGKNGKPYGIGVFEN